METLSREGAIDEHIVEMLGATRSHMYHVVTDHRCTGYPEGAPFYLNHQEVTWASTGEPVITRCDVCTTKLWLKVTKAQVVQMVLEQAS